jgi:hypothetical protein
VERRRSPLAQPAMVQFSDALPRHVGNHEPHDLPFDPIGDRADRFGDRAVQIRGRSAVSREGR